MLCSMSAFGTAEVVKVPVSKQKQSQSLTIPPSGITMVEVENSLGRPLIKNKPVGKPPIARWNYGEFTVYFEYDRVLHTVINFKPVQTGMNENKTKEN